MKSYEFEGFEIIIDTQPFGMFNDLQSMAKKEGWTKAFISKSDTHFCVVVKDGIPYYSYTAQKLSSTVVRVATKLYSNPELRAELSLKEIKAMKLAASTLFDHPDFSEFKLKVITRHPSLPERGATYKRVGYNECEDLYLINGKNEDQIAWKKLFYKGDLELLNRPRITQKQYVQMFGNYTFNYNWSKPAIENARELLQKPKACLEIGTFEGRFAIWLAETFKCSVTAVDPFDGSKYGIAKEIFVEAERNCRNNFAHCKQDINLIQGESFDVMNEMYLNGRTFDFIYIDGSHLARDVLADMVMAYRILRDDGIILLDDSVSWKARDHISNETIHDPSQSPRMAVDNFIHIHWKEIEVLKLPHSGQVAFRKLRSCQPQQ
jgi:predicted O-methyltransferase YrrM